MNSTSETIRRNLTPNGMRMAANGCPGNPPSMDQTQEAGRQNVRPLLSLDASFTKPSASARSNTRSQNQTRTSSTLFISAHSCSVLLPRVSRVQYNYEALAPWLPAVRPIQKCHSLPPLPAVRLMRWPRLALSAALSPLFASFFFSFPTTLSLLMSCTRLLLWSKSRPPSKARGDLG